MGDLNRFIDYHLRVYVEILPKSREVMRTVRDHSVTTCCLEHSAVQRSDVFRSCGIIPLHYCANTAFLAVNENDRCIGKHSRLSPRLREVHLSCDPRVTACDLRLGVYVKTSSETAEYQNSR